MIADWHRVAGGCEVPLMSTIRRGTLSCLLLVLPLSALAPQGAGRRFSGPDSASSTRRIKIGASTLLGIPSVGVERPLVRAGRTFQWDLMVSPWVSVRDYPFEFVTGTAEWRAYRGGRSDGWYAALHTGVAAFRLQRWDYRDTTIYHEGASFLGGGTVGRVWRTRRGWLIDAYVGGGTTQSLYKSYDRLTGSRADAAKLWNISSEFLPYRTGLSIGLP